MRTEGRKRIINTATMLERRKVRQPWTSFERAVLTAAMLLQTCENDEDFCAGLNFGVERGDFPRVAADNVRRCLQV